MNSSNGLCLCVLHDALFDKGYVSILDGAIIYSPALLKDEALNKIVRFSINDKIREAKFDKVNPDFLKYYQLDVFIQ